MSTDSKLNAIQHECAVDFVFVKFEDQGPLEELLRLRLRIDKREQLAAVVARVASEHFPEIATEFNDYHVDLGIGSYHYFGFKPSGAEMLNFRPRSPSYYISADGSAFTALGLPITLEMVENSVEAELSKLHVDEVYIYPPEGGRGGGNRRAISRFSALATRPRC